MGFSMGHLLVVLLVVLLVFGTKRLRSIGGDLGGAIKGFRDAMNDGKEAETVAMKSPERIEHQSAHHTVDAAIAAKEQGINKGGV